MKLGIKSRSLRSYSTRRLKKAALQRGHLLKVLDAIRFGIDLVAGGRPICFGNFESMREPIPHRARNARATVIAQLTASDVAHVAP